MLEHLPELRIATRCWIYYLTTFASVNNTTISALDLRGRPDLIRCLEVLIVIHASAVNESSRLLSN